MELSHTARYSPRSRYFLRTTFLIRNNLYKITTLIHGNSPAFTVLDGLQRPVLLCFLPRHGAQGIEPQLMPALAENQHSIPIVCLQGQCSFTNRNHGCTFSAGRKCRSASWHQRTWTFALSDIVGQIPECAPYTNAKPVKTLKGVFATNG